MGMGLLIDLTLCLGCRACQVACKQWNNLQAVGTEFSPEFTNPPDRTACTWTTIEPLPGAAVRRARSAFVKVQCMHCEQPACVTVCVGGALRKTADGPVTVTLDRCVGCLSCQEACPYGVPRYQAGKAVPKMRKCTMCSDRITAGMPPACAAACPTGTILFGERPQLLEIAHRRIVEGRKLYVNRVYGEHERGGTAVLYVSDTVLKLTELKRGWPRGAQK